MLLLYSRDRNQLKLNFEHKIKLVGGDRKHLKTDISFTPIFPNAHSETGQDVLLRTHHCCYSGSSTCGC